jgi:Ca-activated chloride channel family protein
MRRRSRGWVWIAGVGMLAGLCCGAGMQVSGQAPLSPAPAQSNPATGGAPLSQDVDPVASPDSIGVIAGPPSLPAEADSAPNAIAKENGRLTLHAQAYEVRLNASVIDSSGRTVDSLPQDAFHVFEDGVPQTILGFRHEDLPVSLGILIDSSGSMYDKRPAVDAASLDLVKLSNPQDEAFLVDFSSEAYIDQDFTNSISKLQQGLSYIKSSGGTALYDAVIASADYLAKNAKRSKQVLLIITDGDDNASSATLESAIRRVQDLDGPAIYCIGLLFGEDVSHSDARHSKEVLSELAAQTGGQAYFPKSLKDVDGITQEVAQDIRTQYTIQYRSTRGPELGGYREIHVEARGKGFRGLQVRTRTGYFPKVPGSAAAGSAEPAPGQR